MFRMAIEYLPKPSAKEFARYVLIVYGATGKFLWSWAYRSMEDLFAALRSAGISLEKEEEELIVRGKDAQEPFVMVADGVKLSRSHLSALGAQRYAEQE
jgi:hypothetical protein